MLELRVTFKDKKAIGNFILWHVVRFFTVPIGLMRQNWRGFKTSEKSFFGKFRKFNLLRFFMISTFAIAILGFAVYFLFLSQNIENSAMITLLICLALYSMEIVAVTVVVFFVAVELAIRLIKTLGKTLFQLTTEVS